MLNKPYIHNLKSFDAGNNSGILTFAQELDDIPFNFSRVFFTYNVGKDRTRGGHAHKNIYQALISVSGDFMVSCEDINGDITNFHLNKPDICLIIPPLFWSIQSHFSENAVCLVLASGPYDEKEYIRNKAEFIAPK
jgi:dTDP-4-dehydrorhamnose 3,5-epimerase-like enzyme